MIVVGEQEALVEHVIADGRDLGLNEATRWPRSMSDATGNLAVVEMSFDVECLRLQTS